MGKKDVADSVPAADGGFFSFVNADGRDIEGSITFTITQF
jgi:hypothetical protein